MGAAPGGHTSSSGGGGAHQRPKVTMSESTIDSIYFTPNPPESVGD